MVKLAEVSRLTGKPEINRLSEDMLAKLRPGGRVPELNDHENGPLPPVAWMVCWYAVPTVPLAIAGVTIIRGAVGDWLEHPASQINSAIPRAPK